MNSDIRIYVACHCRLAARAVADELRKEGFSISSHWHDSTTHMPTFDSLDPEQASNIADDDVQCLRNSDALVLVSGPDRYTGGKFFEAGFAYGRDLPVFVFGRRENVMMHAYGIDQFNYIPELAQQIKDFFAD